MLIAGTVTMIVLNDPIKEVLERDIRVLRASIDADSRVNVLTSREDAGLEGNSFRIALIVVFVPDFLSKVFTEERFGALGEHWPVDKIFR